MRSVKVDALINRQREVSAPSLRKQLLWHFCVTVSANRWVVYTRRSHVADASEVFCLSFGRQVELLISMLIQN